MQDTTPVTPNGENLILVPTPSSVRPMPGHELRMDDVAIMVHDGRFAQTDVMVEQLRDELVRRGVQSTLAPCATGEEARTAIHLRLDASLDVQCYTIDIDERGVEVRGGDLDGVRYGVQTMRQIIRQTAPVLPGLRIVDHPEMPMRGYYLDVSRGRVPTLAWLKRWVDELCLYKYNQLQLYVEHTFAFPGMSEAWRGASPLEADDIRALDEYCHVRGIELVPSVSTFGHLYMALRTAALRELGEFPENADRRFGFVERMQHHTLNVTLEKSFAFSRSLIDSVMPLFRSRRFNICADETFDLGRGRSRQTDETASISSLYVGYVNRLCDYVSSCGRTPMLWGDIAVEMPEVLPRLSPDALLLNWQYDPQCTAEKVVLVAERGVRQIVCPAAHAWNRLLPFIEPTWRNISRLARYGRESNSEGFLLTDWGDFGHVNDPVLSLPALVMGGQCAWSAQETSFAWMSTAISRFVYHDRTGTFLQTADRACAQTAAVWEDVVRFLEVEEPDGSVNADVVDSLWWVDAEARRDICVRNDLRGARRLAMHNVAAAFASRYAEGGGRGAGALHMMQDACRSAYPVDSAMPDDVRVWLLFARGQDLMNELGLALAAEVGALDNDITRTPADAETLAGELERWFELYCTRWREVSREAELRRIAAVLWAACDHLRASAHQR